MKNAIKKAISVLLVAVMVFGAAPLAGFMGLELPSIGDIFATKVKAEEAPTSGTCGKNLYWEFDKNTGDLTISGTGVMYSYNKENAPWNSYKSKIYHVIVSEGVKSIGSYAFYCYPNLSQVTFPETLETISESAFYQCNLYYISIPASVSSIGSTAFHWNYNLISFTVDERNSVYSSENGVLFNKNKTRLIMYPPEKTGNYYSVPESVKEIEWCSFANNSYVSQVYIGPNVQYIDSSPFFNCSSLQKILVDDKNSYFSTDNFYALFDKDKSELIQFPIGSSASSYAIPDSVAYLGQSAFAGYSNLREIIIPSSIKYLGMHSFYWCVYLRHIEIPASIYDIDSAAFEHCYSLETVTLNEGLTEIGASAFLDCTQLISINLPNSLTEIGSFAFDNCSSLTDITIPRNVTSIGTAPFRNCSSLQKINVSKESKTYYNDYSGALLSYDGYMIQFPEKNNVSEYMIPAEITSIWSYAFENCDNLTGVTILGSLVNIGRYAFADCTRLSSVTIHDGVTSIGDFAFADCEKLTSITIPKSVTSINFSAFLCSSLTEVYYTGTKAQWNAIAIDSGNEPLTGATIYYNYNQPDKNSLASSSPANGETHFSLEKDIILTFTNKIQGVSVDTICIRDYETDKVVCTAGINCIEKNGNTLTLKHMVHTPIVDGNGKTVEGGKLKGNMKYYLDIPSYAISFSDGYFEGTKSKDDLAFSTYISKDRSLKEYGFKQEYTEGSKIQESISNNQAEFKYFYRNNEVAGKALDDFCIPGLKEGMVPQGLTYYPEKHWYLISAYHKSDLPAEEKNNSVIYALNESGEFVAQFNIHTAYGKDSRIHAGGIAVSKHNLYLTYYDSQIAYIPLSELNVPDYTVKDVCIRSSVDLKDLMGGTGTAYLNYSENYSAENILWTGNFYCTTFEAKLAGAAATEDETGWNTPASEKANSIMLGYRIDGTDGLSEWNSLTQIVENDGATYTIYLPDKYDGIQGATIHNGVIYLSRAEWRPSNYDNNTALLAHEIYLLGQPEITLPDKNWVVVNNLPGAENIFVKNNKLYCVYEASALGEIKFLLWNTKVETDVIWEIDIKKLLKNTRLGTVNCPVDVEIYDEETGELVGRIKDNIVDSEIADKDNSVPMEVDGDTKYYWLPTDKKYKVVFIGNDDGTMDYTVSLFDENGQLKERGVFYDIPLSDGLTYNDEAEIGNSLSKSVLETEDGIKINPDQYFDNMQNAKAEISVSSNEGGAVTESFSAVYGDKVTIEASAKDGYIFYAWIENGEIVSTDAEYSFVLKKDRTLKAEFIAFSLRTPSTTTIKYGDSIILHADLSEALPAGWWIEWTASNGNFEYTVSVDGTTCTITPDKKGDTTFIATVYDAEGNAVSIDEQTMTSKAGFFDKIIAFFKKLFSLTKVIPQVFKGI